MSTQNRMQALKDAYNKSPSINNNEQGCKLDNNKPRLDLIPAEFTIETAKALTFGVKKYGEHNYRKGIKYSRLIAGIMRHLLLWLSGVETDEESGLPHLACAQAGLAMLAFMRYNRKDLDDRFNYESTEHLVDLMYGD